MYLQKHHIAHIVPVIEARLKTIKRRYIKEYRDDWGDYDDDGIEFKIIEKDTEYARLKQSVRILKETAH